MMKKISKLALLAAATAFLLAAFPACSNDDDDNTPTVDNGKTSLEGVWSYTMGQETAYLYADGTTLYEATKESDKYTYAKDEPFGTYTVDGDTVKVTVGESEILVKLSDNSLTFPENTFGPNVPEITATKIPGATADSENQPPAEDVSYEVSSFTAAINAANITLDSSSPKKLPAMNGTPVAIDGEKLVLLSNGAGNLRLREDGTINYNGDSKRYVAVDTSKFGATGKLKVTFNIKTVISADVAANNDVGIAFLSTSVNDCPQDSSAYTTAPAAGTGDVLAVETALKFSKTDNNDKAETRTLTATVDAGTKVYLFLSRNGAVKKNGDSSGGIDLTSVKVETAN